MGDHDQRAQRQLRFERHNPVVDDQVAGATRSPQAAALLERLAAAPVPPPPTAARTRASRRRVAAAVAVAVVTVVALAAVLPATLLPGGRLGASPAAAQTLERLAAVAVVQETALGGPYLYTKARVLSSAMEASSDPFTVLLPSVQESWIARDGSGRLRESGGRPVFMSERDRQRWVQTGGWVDERPPSDQRFGPREHYAADARLPIDPDELEAALRARAETENPPPEDGYSIAGEMLQEIADLLHSPAASPKLRASLFRVMARLDGVELVGEVTDPLDRPGVAISGPAFYDDGETARRLVIVDPGTSEVLAEQTLLRRRVDWIDAEPPFVIGETVYLESGWVDSLEEIPSEASAS